MSLSEHQTEGWTSSAGLNEVRVKEFSVCPEGGALLLTGTRGYLHLLSLKVGGSISVNTLILVCLHNVILRNIMKVASSDAKVHCVRVCALRPRRWFAV